MPACAALLSMMSTRAQMRATPPLPTARPPHSAIDAHRTCERSERRAHIYTRIERLERQPADDGAAPTSGKHETRERARAPPRLPARRRGAAAFLIATRDRRSRWSHATEQARASCRTNRKPGASGSAVVTNVARECSRESALARVRPPPGTPPHPPCTAAPRLSRQLR